MNQKSEHQRKSVVSWLFPQSICPGALGSKLNYSKLVIDILSEHLFLKKNLQCLKNEKQAEALLTTQKSYLISNYKLREYNSKYLS